MPFLGGLPFPRRFGGGTPVLRRIMDSLAAQLGTAYDPTSSSTVYPFLQAYGRAVAAAWSANARLANQWSPSRCTDFIGRWETIFGIVPKPTDTDTTRRARLSAAFSRVLLVATYQATYDQIANLLGSVLVKIIHTASGSAVVWTPAGWPVGSHDPALQTNWYSNVAHILIQVQQPTGMSDADFYATVGGLNPLLDAILPAWVTWDWAMFLSGSAEGFYLDGDAMPSGTLANLDTESFN